MYFQQTIQTENQCKGVGIHSGKIITGSMGGAEKIEYALIGDSVNVAARLESLNKEKMKRFPH